mmetsp:Transcript_23547/g.23797  ORF Transcript_23547/g.23797 Transcript_23547/m.23797 type:complete len:92 (+) Transcript_23547:214-489(+)
MSIYIRSIVIHNEPIMNVIRSRRQRIQAKFVYAYVTSLVAIMGGMLTIIGMIESSIHTAVSKRRRSSMSSSSNHSNRGNGVAQNKLSSNPY